MLNRAGMAWARRPRLGPAVRIGLGLTALVITLLLIIDIVFNVFPNPSVALSAQRARSAEQLALQSIVMLELGHEASIARAVELALSSDADITRIRLERKDETAVVDMRAPGLAPAQARDMRTAYQVPLMTRDGLWGRLTVWHRDSNESQLSIFLNSPLVQLIAGLGIVCFVAFALYLRRVLSHLDPSSVVPERIRQAFDVFSSGIVVVDHSAAILLANERFRMLASAASGEALTGMALHRLPMFAEALSVNREGDPWALAMSTGETLSGARLDIRHADGSLRRLLVNSAPIDDGDGQVRGCLISFEDISSIVDLNEQLERSNAELLRSQRNIEEMNEALTRLVTRDALTGTFNSRALFDRFGTLFAEARSQGQPLCCIMLDIDHFKRFNDTHGHATGDEVLRAVTRVIAKGLRDRDVLARYGGEEFCIVLPGADLTTALVVAERLREAIELTAGASVRKPAGLRVTASFGVSALNATIGNFELLMHQADEALYASKNAGRNRVTSAAPA